MTQLIKTLARAVVARPDEMTLPLGALGSLARFVVVFDGAYAAKALVRPLLAEGATVVTRLRSDAKLFDFLSPERGSVVVLASMGRTASV